MDSWWLSKSKPTRRITIAWLNIRKHRILQYPTTNLTVGTLHWYVLEYPPNGENEVSYSFDHISLFVQRTDWECACSVAGRTLFEGFGVFSWDALESWGFRPNGYSYDCNNCNESGSRISSIMQYTTMNLNATPSLRLKSELCTVHIAEIFFLWAIAGICKNSSTNPVKLWSCAI